MAANVTPVVDTKDEGWPNPPPASDHPRTELEWVAQQLAELRIQRDELIRAHPGTLRAIGEAAGLSPQAVLNIKNRKEEK